MSLSRSVGSRIAAAVGKSLRKHQRKARDFGRTSRAFVRPLMEPLEDRTLFTTLYPIMNSPDDCVFWYVTPYCGCNGEVQYEIGLVPIWTGLNTVEALASGNPVRYFDGSPIQEATDLSSDGFGKTYSQTRSWSQAMSGAGIMGNHWVATNLPQLTRQVGSDQGKPSGATDTIVLMASGTNQRWFDSFDTNTPHSYTERFGGQDQLSIDTVNNRATVTDAGGGKTTFVDPTGSAANAGQFISFADPYNNSTSVYGNLDSLGNITEVRRSNGNAIESWVYSYITNPNDPSKELLQNVKLRRSTDGTNFTTIRQVTYSYYASGDTGGNANDLKSAAIADGSGNPIGTSYYRYWTGNDPAVTENGNPVFQPPGSLKYVLGPQSYARMVAALPGGTTVDSATDAQIAPYADSHFTYTGTTNTDGVYQEVAAGAGGAATNGQGTFSYQYGIGANKTNPNWTTSDLTNYNFYKYKTVETKPDGTVHTIYSNWAGEPMLDATTSGANNWGTFYKYDGTGNLLWKAQPSAVSLPSSLSTLDNYNDVLNYSGGKYTYLNDHAGLIDVNDYYASTGSGGVETVYRPARIFPGARFCRYC